MRRLADQLANDHTVTAYDFWKALGKIEDELHELQRDGQPIPFRLLQQRRIIAEAQKRREED